jgi:3-hydroxyacyl-[acyl-carrier-protein] dehydratase
MKPESADLTAALASLPHGPEFRFLDRLVSLTPGREGVGEYRVRGDEPFLRGHFPDEPLMPGVLLVEAAAQLAGVVAQTDPVAGAMQGLKLTAIRAAKITGTASPGDTVRIEARITGRLGGLIQADTEATVRGRQVLKATLALSGVNAAMRVAIAPQPDAKSD